jgi:polysaccharide export outer membrane protein
MNGINPTSNRKERGWQRRLRSTILICGLAAGQAWAQEGSTKSEQVMAASAIGQPASSEQPLPPKAEGDSFVIGADDVLAVNVWKEPDISRSIPVRSDGKITLPLVGEFQAGGQTPRQLEKEIAAKLQNYIFEPEVTVMVQEIRSQRFNVLGQVAKPGSYLLANSARVLDAIALAGGFRDFAKKKSIYVLRSNPEGGQSRLPFNYVEVIKGKSLAQNVELKPHDTVIVP